MLKKEEIDIVERAVAARMSADIPIVKLEIADHLITNIEKIMEEDKSINFYIALKESLRNYGGQKEILNALKSKSRQSQKEIVFRTIKSASWFELSLSFLLLLFLLQSGFAEQINLHRVYFASMIPVFFVVYKRILNSKEKTQLLVDGILFCTILPYSLVSTCLSVIKDYNLVLTAESTSIVFTLTYIAIIYMLLRHRAVYQMMIEELEVVNKLSRTSN